MATLLTRLGSDVVSLGPTLRQAGSWGWKLIDLSGALLSREPERWPIRESGADRGSAGRLDTG